MVTLLSKDPCPQCDMTKKLFKREGIEYTERRMDLDAEAMKLAKDLGYLQAPVVIAPDGTSWSGFRPDKIGELV